MVRKILPIALAAGVALGSFDTQAADNLTLKSVSVDLPAGDRTFPDGPGADVANDNCLACHSAGMVLYQPALPKARHCQLNSVGRPSWPLSLERGQPYRRAKDFSAPDRRATRGRRIPPLLKLTMPPAPMTAEHTQSVTLEESLGR
jgi:hypothetical protein